MGQVLRTSYEDFGSGVITSLKPDVLPPNASPRGWNSALTDIAGGKCVVSKRPGLLCLTSEPVYGHNNIIGQYSYKRRDEGGRLHAQHMVVTQNGYLYYLDVNDYPVCTFVEITDTLDWVLPKSPDFVVADNLLFILNGIDAVKWDGTTLTNDGIIAPGAPGLAAIGGGVMDGTYEVALTYYNSSTGHESSRSPANAIILSSHQIEVTIPDAPDPQVDYVRIYIREDTLSGYFFKVVSGTGYDDVGGGWPDGYGPVVLNITDDELVSLIILAPDESENNPVPAGARFQEWHHSRRFVADSKMLYYSKVGLPEAFDPDFFLPINTDDGEAITGLYSTGGILLIFKNRSIWGLFGDDPNTWFLRLLDDDSGCISFQSIVAAEDALYWWSFRGPMRWETVASSKPEAIGMQFLGDDVHVRQLHRDMLNRLCAVVDTANQRVIFAYPEHLFMHNRIWLPWNYRLNRWESNKWDPLDACSMATIDIEGVPHVAVGSYGGQIFQFDAADNDGVPGGTMTGTFVATTEILSEIEDLTAEFWTEGGGLVDRRVTILDSQGRWVGRAIIDDRDQTSTLIPTAFVGSVPPAPMLTIGETYTYIIGGPDFQWDTPWDHFSDAYTKKRFEHLYLNFDSAEDTPVDVNLAFDFNPEPGQAQPVDITPPSTTWNSTIWTVGTYATGELKPHRLRIGRTGRTWKARICQPWPDKPLTIRRIAAQAEAQTTKIG